MNDSKYEALATKVKAMYGRRLRYDDFSRMAAMPDVPAVLDYLRQTPWAPAIDALDARPQNRAALEAVLREQTREEYVRLNAFVPREDRALLAYPVRMAELEGIMGTLRRLKAGQTLEPVPSRFLLHSRMDPAQLTACTDFDALTAAAEHTIYATALRRLRPEEEGGLPDYQVAESLLRTVYFSSFFRLARQHRNPEIRNDFLQTLGTQVDLLNIIHILRLKRYFPDLTTRLPYLFPFHCHMTPAQLSALAAAPSLEAAFGLLGQTRYAQAFQEVEVSEVEDYYRQAMYRLHRRQVLTGPPSVCTAAAYLHLKEAEVSALINVIESVNYGAPFDDRFVKLIGT